MIGSIDEKLKVLTAEQEKENDQKWDTAVALESDGKGFIEVHETDEGYDYSIYSPDKKLMDGGVLEDTYQTAYQIAVSLCEENGFAQPSIVTDYDAFLEQVEAANEVKSSYRDVAVYYETANYAYEAGELDQCRTSRDANMACAAAIEIAISANYADNRLSTEAALSDVLARFSPERVQCVLANTIQQNLQFFVCIWSIRCDFSKNRHSPIIQSIRTSRCQFQHIFPPCRSILIEIKDKSI